MARNGTEEGSPRGTEIARIPGTQSGDGITETIVKIMTEIDGRTGRAGDTTERIPGNNDTEDGGTMMAMIGDQGKGAGAVRHGVVKIREAYRWMDEV